MEHKDLTLRGNALEVKFVSYCNASNFDKISPEFVIGGNIIFQMRILTCRHYIGNNSNLIHVNIIFVRFHNQRSDENYNVKFTCNELNIKDKCFTSDDGVWHPIYETRKEQQEFILNILVVVDVLPVTMSFAPLHEDEELTDFEMRGDDGAVKVHKTVLAAASPVLRRMLSGTWRETTEGYAQFKGTSRATLQHLKNYIYLSTLPEEGLEELMSLASCYIPDLKQKCVDKLLIDKSHCDLKVIFAKKS